MGLTIQNENILFNDKPLLLRGVAIPDIYWLENKESTDITSVLKKVKSTGANVVRYTVVPGHLLFYKNYLEERVRQIVNLCNELDLFCILDWHALGNPITNTSKYTEYKHIVDGKEIYWYNASFELAKKGWKKISELFAHEEHVLFELFNEPAPGEKDVQQLDLKALPWTTWKEMQQGLIDIVREYSDDKIIIVNSNYWTFNLLETSKNLYEDKKVVYAFHCYAIRNNKNWREMLDSLKHKPIIMTEWGFDSKEDSFFYGTIEEYAKPLIDYCDLNKIHWTAWCFSASWSPRMLKSWEPLEYSTFGKFVLKKLSNEK